MTILIKHPCKSVRSGVVCSRCFTTVELERVEFVDDYPVCAKCLTHPNSRDKSFIDNNQYTMMRWDE